MNHDHNESTAKISARRRLVRGVFAAPAALSLYSGSAFAATSLTCVAKDVAGNQNPEPSFSSDTFIRVRLWTLTRTSNGSISNWVKGQDVASWRAPNTNAPFIGSTDWICYLGNTNQGFTAGQILLGQQPTTNQGLLAQDGAWVALKIDSLGNITGVVGIGGPVTGQSAIHQSCWTSFRKV